MTKEEIRLRVTAELAMGATPRELAQRYDVPYVTILSWKKQQIKEQEGLKDLDTVVDVDLETLHTVAKNVKAVAPAEVAKKIDKLVDGVTSLQQLEPKFHAVCLQLLKRAEAFALDEELSVKEWSVISTGIGQLYANIFNKSGVNVNVLNQTQVSGEKLQMFKASTRSN